MCGIFGVFGPGASGDWQAAAQSLHHRGPDRKGLWRSPDNTVLLGHTRLAILDLDPRADQPMVCPETGNVLVFNGEIYNFPELRRELEGHGRVFRTRGDTEVLLAAYARWGRDCLARLNGMFAFAVYEPGAERLFLARDRVGKKPLYFASHRGRLGFASELKGLLALWPDLPRQVAPEALAAYLDLGYVPGSLAIFRGVSKLPPAHWGCLEGAADTLQVKRYWELPPPGSGNPEETAAVERLDELLDDATRLRLQSDVPVGLFLSGGLDSSLVAACVARHRPDLVAYTAGFADARFDESTQARRVAARLGLRHQVLPVRPGAGEDLGELGHQFDEPFGDSSLLPTFLISRAMRREVTVALSGDGGDELFAGYLGYAAAVGGEALQQWPRPLRQVLGAGHRLLPIGMPGRNFLRRLPLDGLGRYLQRTRGQEEVRRWPLAPAWAEAVAPWPRDGFRRGLLADMERRWGPLSLLQQLTRLDFLSYLPDDVLVKVDRASMLTSLEVRSPLLDYRIVEFAYALPDHLRFRDGRGKVLLRALGRRYLPADFPFERKQGFSIPEGAWFRGEWRDLPGRLARNSELVDANGLARLAALHRRSGRMGSPLFRLLMLLLFEDNHAERT